MKRYLFRSAILVGLLSALSSLAYALDGPKKPPEGMLELDLRPEIKESIAKIPSAKPLPAQLKMLRMRHKDAQSEIDIERHFEGLENRLWIVTDVYRGKTTRFVRWLALEGMVGLTKVVDFGGDFNSNPFVALGKLFVFMQETKNFRSQGYMNAITATGDFGAVVAPKSNEKFSFEVNLEGKNTVVISGGLFGPSTRTSEIKNYSATNCVVGAAQDASSLSATLRGAYLPVTCEAFDSHNDVKTISDWAYLIESEVYVVLRYVIGRQETRYRILDAEYVPAKPVSGDTVKLQ